MTWPSAATKNHLDQSSDDPKQARTELADLVDKFNQLQAHVSSLNQTILAQTTAANIRDQLGASSGLWPLSIGGTGASTASGARNNLGLGTAAVEAWLSTVSQAEAEAGTATTQRFWTAQRVSQAIDALASTATAGTALVQNPYASSANVTQAHGLGAEPTFIVVVLECLTAEFGYSEGDRIVVGFAQADSVGSDTVWSIRWDATNVELITKGSSARPRIIRKDTNATGDITAANWKVEITPYLVS